MKRNIIYLTLVAAVALLASCSTKDNVTPTPVATTYTFKLNGVTYTETAAADSSSTVTVGNVTAIHVVAVAGISADKSATAVLEFVFPGAAAPAAGTYNLGTTSTSVGLLAYDKTSAVKNGIYSADGSDNSAITVTVSSSGKLGVKFPSIALKGNTYDNTDPKNTVIANVTGTASGSFSE